MFIVIVSYCETNFPTTTNISRVNKLVSRLNQVLLWSFFACNKLNHSSQGIHNSKTILNLEDKKLSKPLLSRHYKLSRVGCQHKIKDFISIIDYVIEEIIISLTAWLESLIQFFFISIHSWYMD